MGSRVKLGESTWRIVTHEERSTGHAVYFHYTLSCSRCGNVTAVLSPPREEPIVELCQCLAIVTNEEGK